MNASGTLNPPPITVLNYHNLVEANRESPNDLHSISIERFNEHIITLKREGFTPIKLKDAFKVLISLENHKPGFVITFDDAYASLRTYKDKIHPDVEPTVFILTDYIGKSTAIWNTRSSVVLNHLDLEGLYQIQDIGFDIQMHGLDHHNLLKFSTTQLQTRFEKSNKWFRHHFEEDPRYLAYPYGYCDDRVQDVVSRFYQGALSINHGKWFGPEAQYALNRMSVPYYLSGSDLVSILYSSPEKRWYETERRAPWRKNREGKE